MSILAPTGCINLCPLKQFIFCCITRSFYHRKILFLILWFDFFQETKCVHECQLSDIPDQRYTKNSETGMLLINHFVMTMWWFPWPHYAYTLALYEWMFNFFYVFLLTKNYTRHTKCYHHVASEAGGLAYSF